MNKQLSLSFLLSMAVVCASATERPYQERCRIAQSILAPHQSSVARSPLAPDQMKALTLFQENDQLTVLGYQNGGFVIVSNDDDNKAVVGYSTTSTFSEANASLQWFLDRASRNLAAKQVTAKATIPADCKDNVAHLVTAKWNQDDPYSNKCPTDKAGTHCYTGCVATAMAQIMHYYKYPEYGIGQDTIYFEKKQYVVNFGSTSYDWDSMLDSYDGSYSVTQKFAVATLMYHCGVAAHMMYSIDGSGACLDDAAEGMTSHFGYITKRYGYKESSTSDDYNDAKWREVIYRELSAGHPIMYAGTSNSNGDNNMSTHCFVFDGYDSDGYIGVNWGYGGLGDGYFDFDALICTAYTPSEDYRWWHEMVLIHQPEDGPIDYDLEATDIQKTTSVDSNQPVRIYDLSGRLIYTTTASAFSLDDIPTHGMVIVKTGDAARKVVVK